MSNEDSIVEEENDTEEPQDDLTEEYVAITDIDDNAEEVEGVDHTMPRRTNDGAGI